MHVDDCALNLLAHCAQRACACALHHAGIAGSANREIGLPELSTEPTSILQTCELYVNIQLLLVIEGAQMFTQCLFAERYFDFSDAKNFSESSQFGESLFK